MAKLGHRGGANKSTIEVDFSPKGGPKGLGGVWDVAHAAIQWADGNNWTKATACASTEYCCPDALHCLTPTKTSCAGAEGEAACGEGQVCCPLTKICVIPGAPCASNCEGDETYCCPDALHCLKPANPGVFCDPTNASDCPASQVCCPLTRLCVDVQAACTP